MIDVKVLRAAGLTDSQIVAVYEATSPLITALNELRERLAEIREQNRKRKKNQRTRHVTSHVTVTGHKKPNGINGHVTGTTNGATPFLKEESKIQEKKEESKGVVRGRKCLLPLDWRMKPAHFAWVAKRNPTWSSTEVEQFVDNASDDLRHWADKDEKQRINWDAQAYAFLKPKGGLFNGTATKPNGIHGRRETLDERCQRLGDEALRLERSAGIDRADDAFGSH